MRGKNAKWIFVSLLIVSYLAYCVTWLYPAFYAQGLETPIPVNELPGQLRLSLTWTGKVRTVTEILMPVFLIMSSLWIWFYLKKRNFVNFLLCLLSVFGILFCCFLLIALIEKIFFSNLNVYADLWLVIFYMFLNLMPYILAAIICFVIFKLVNGVKKC